MGITVSLLNQKGGVGKSSSVHHLAGTLAKDGHRMLVLDNDPQSSLTQGFFGPDATRRIGGPESVAALYDPDLAPIPGVLIRPTGFERLSIVPGSKKLTPYNMLPADRWHAMTRLDHNRALAALAAKAGVGNDAVTCMTIWGNHSNTQFPDFTNTKINGKPALEVIPDRAWLETAFVKGCQERGKAVIEKRGLSSAFSAGSLLGPCRWRS